MFGTSGRARWDRPSADTLVWRLSEFQTQKNRLEVGLCISSRRQQRDGTSGRARWDRPSADTLAWRLHEF